MILVLKKVGEGETTTEKNTKKITELKSNTHTPASGHKEKYKEKYKVTEELK